MERLAARCLGLYCRGCSTSAPSVSSTGLLHSSTRCYKRVHQMLHTMTVRSPSICVNAHSTSPSVLHTVAKNGCKRWSSWLTLSRAARTFSSEAKKKAGYVMPLWQRLALVVGFAGAGYYFYQSALLEQDLKAEIVRYKEFTKAKLGGDFTLTDHFGNVKSSSVYRGQWLLIYLGFTHCPDICPEELEKLAHLVKMIDEDPWLPNMQPLFITLDPERDTPAAIKDYLKEYKNPRMVGFTGTLEEITVVAKQFRAYFGKGPADEDNDYIVDHTIIIYLINPEGQFVNYFDRSNSAETIKKSVTRHVQLYDEMQRRKNKS